MEPPKSEEQLREIILGAPSNVRADDVVAAAAAAAAAAPVSVLSRACVFLIYFCLFCAVINSSSSWTHVLARRAAVVRNIRVTTAICPSPRPYPDFDFTGTRRTGPSLPPSHVARGSVGFC